MKKTTSSNIDEYIESFAGNIQKLLKQMRATIHKAAPEADETMSYGIPTFKLNGNLVHFAAFKNHIGFYPAPSGIEAFKKEVAPYEAGKGSLQFPLEKPLPLQLVTKIVKYRIQENMQKSRSKRKAMAK